MLGICPLTNRPATRPEVIVGEEWLPNGSARLGSFEQDDALIMMNHSLPIDQSNRVRRANVRRLRQLGRLLEAKVEVAEQQEVEHGARGVVAANPLDVASELNGDVSQKDMSAKELA